MQANQLIKKEYKFASAATETKHFKFSDFSLFSGNKLIPSARRLSDRVSSTKYLSLIFK